MNKFIRDDKSIGGVDSHTSPDIFTILVFSGILLAIIGYVFFKLIILFDW